MVSMRMKFCDMNVPNARAYSYIFRSHLGDCVMCCLLPREFSTNWSLDKYLKEVCFPTFSSAEQTAGRFVDQNWNLQV